MKKVLIFTLPTGNGHNQVAKSLSTMLSNSETQVKIVNPFDESSTFIKTVIHSGYLFTASRAPFIYSKLYKYSNKKTVPAPIAELYQRKLLKLLQIQILSEKPDMVISVHPLINQPLSKIKENLSFPLISFITDYRCHKFYIAENIDFYITGSRDTSQDIIDAGVDQTRVFSYGIPVSETFLSKNRSSNRIFNKNDMPLRILIMGGSLGMGLSKKKTLKIIRSLNNCNYTIICGKNKKLFDELRELINSFKLKNVKIVGFTEEVPLFMHNADVLISKPGGITLTEAVLSRVPIIVPYAIPGQEEENALFIEKNKIGKIAPSTKEIIRLLKYYHKNRDALSFLRNNCHDLSRDYSLEKTKELLNTILDEQKIKQQNQFSLTDSAACG